MGFGCCWAVPLNPSNQPHTHTQTGTAPGAGVRRSQRRRGQRQHRPSRARGAGARAPLFLLLLLLSPNRPRPTPQHQPPRRPEPRAARPPGLATAAGAAGAPCGGRPREGRLGGGGGRGVSERVVGLSVRSVVDFDVGVDRYILKSCIIRTAPSTRSGPGAQSWRRTWPWPPASRGAWRRLGWYVGGDG